MKVLKLGNPKVILFVMCILSLYTFDTCLRPNIILTQRRFLNYRNSSGNCPFSIFFAYCMTFETEMRRYRNMYKFITYESQIGLLRGKVT